MKLLKIYQCSNCKSQNLLYLSSLIRCSTCKSEFKIHNGIIDFRNFNNDKTAGFDFNKDYEIAKLLLKIFHLVKYFNGLFFIYEKLNKLTTSNISNLSIESLLLEVKESDSKLSSA